MTPPDVAILLLGGCAPRALELTLDSVLGQTMANFRLLANREALGAAGVVLLNRYGDARLAALDNAEACWASLAQNPTSAGRGLVLLPAGDLLAPTHLSRLLGVLDGAPGATLAVCGTTDFDGADVRRGCAWPTDAAALLQAVDTGQLPSSALMLRSNEALSTRQSAADIPALCRALLDRGDPAPVAAALAIHRVAALEAASPIGQRRPVALYGTAYYPSDIEALRPPTLHVVVDTEAEFDWEQPFAPDLNSVSAVARIESAQAIFDRYGVRPVYVVDYPVATQPAGVAAIRAIVDRGGCAIGAHLHPWTTPPFELPIDRRLSFPGNLPATLEAAKLDALLAAIEQSFGVRPVFYKAGRYGLGPNTVALIADRGARVDYSLMAQTDMSQVDGPDFGDIEPIPYCIGDTGIITLPMTRANLGPLGQARRLRDWLDTALARRLRARGVLARAGLLERLTLTPEGVSAELQIKLLRTLLARGQRLFVLHYHSPSLAAGHTPYVRTEADRLQFLARIETVCRWFFEELGGLPGRPWDLLDPACRGDLRHVGEGSASF